MSRQKCSLTQYNERKVNAILSANFSNSRSRPLRMTTEKGENKKLVSRCEAGILSEVPPWNGLHNPTPLGGGGETSHEYNSVKRLWVRSLAPPMINLGKSNRVQINFVKSTINKESNKFLCPICIMIRQMGGPVKTRIWKAHKQLLVILQRYRRSGWRHNAT